MAALTVTQVLSDAQLAAALHLADTGDGAAYLAFHDTHGGELGRVVLAKPCGTIDDGILSLNQAHPGDDLVMATGAATVAGWYSASGELLASGAVTDASGDGPFKLAGTSGTSLFAGGTITLAGIELS